LTKCYKCKKCRKEFKPISQSKTHSVYDELCESCVEMWLKFFEDNFKRLTAEYPKEFNPTWRIFIGKERVQFT